MPGPCVLGPASLQVNLPKHVAECENAVKMGEVKLRHLLRRCYGAVMRVVKKEFVCARPGAVAAKGLHKSRVVPFVHEDEVGAFQDAVEVEGAGRVRGAFQVRARRMKLSDGGDAVVAQQIAEAPIVGGFVHAHAMAAGQQFAHHSPEKMGVSVVPVGHQGVVEHDNLHSSPRFSVCVIRGALRRRRDLRRLLRTREPCARRYSAARAAGLATPGPPAGRGPR